MLRFDEHNNFQTKSLAVCNGIVASDMSWDVEYVFNIVYHLQKFEQNVVTDASCIECCTCTMQTPGTIRPHSSTLFPINIFTIRDITKPNNPNTHQTRKPLTNSRHPQRNLASPNMRIHTLAAPVLSWTGAYVTWQCCKCQTSDAGTGADGNMWRCKECMHSFCHACSAEAKQPGIGAKPTDDEQQG